MTSTGVRNRGESTPITPLQMAQSSQLKRRNNKLPRHQRELHSLHFHERSGSKESPFPEACAEQRSFESFVSARRRKGGAPAQVQPDVAGRPRSL